MREGMCSRHLGKELENLSGRGMLMLICEVEND